MAHKSYKDVAVKIDNAAGALTAITGSVNQLSLAAALNLLDDSGMGDDDKTFLPGMHGKTISLNGWVDSTTEGIFGPLVADRTSVTKTVELYNGIKYYNGEVYPGNVQISGAADALETWSSDFTFADGMNRTSVAL
jgi:hypothetical protein